MPSHCVFCKDVHVNTKLTYTCFVKTSVSDFYLPLSLPLRMHYNHYPSLRIVIEIRSTFDSLHLLQIGCSYHISVLHVNPLNCDFFNHIFINGLPTCLGHPSVFYKRPSYSFASTISTCCSHGLGTMNATLLPTIYHVSVGAPSS